MALTTYTNDNLNGCCGNCSITFIKQYSHHDGKQKSNYSIINNSVSKFVDCIFANLSQKGISL